MLGKFPYSAVGTSFFASKKDKSRVFLARQFDYGVHQRLASRKQKKTINVVLANELFLNEYISAKLTSMGSEPRDTVAYTSRVRT